MICSELYQIYYTIVSKILDSYPNASPGIRWCENSKYIFDVSLPYPVDKNNITEVLRQSNKTNLHFEKQDLSIDEYLAELNKTNQERQKYILNNYLLYGKHFLKLPDEIYFVDVFEFLLRGFKKYDWGISNLIENINYSFFRFKEIKESEIILIETDKTRVLSFELDIYVSHLFICLAGLIENMTYQKYPIEEALNIIQICKYDRYIRNNKVPVNTISKLIKHYRDAVCHREIENNNICSNTVGGGKVLFYFRGPKLDCEIIFGMGSVHIKNHIMPLIKRLNILLLDKKLPVIKLIDKSGKTMFCDIFIGFDEHIPIKGYNISRLDNNLFRFVIS